MPPTTPDEWLPILAKRLDERAPRIARLRSYADGNAPLPEMGRNLRASWEAFQKKARRNFGGLAISSLADRLVPNGLTIGTESASEAVASAERIWRDNRLDLVFADAIDDYLTTGIGYVAVGIGADGPVVTREKPEQFIATTDPLRPWKARATLKVWRDSDANVDYAEVWTTGMWARYVRDSKTTYGSWIQTAAPSGSGLPWVKVAEGEFDGDPTVAVLERKGGVGLIEPHLDVLDGIALGKLNRLVITAMQAFKQRALKRTPREGTVEELPDVDADGNAIDYSKVFEPAPGALWDLPEGIDIWESQLTDIRPLLDAELTDARDWSALVRCPVSVFIPDSANQSAEGAAAAKEGQISQAKAEIKRLGPGLAVVLVYAVRAAGVDLAGQTVEVLWTPPEHVSLSERYSAAAQAKGSLSLRSIQRDILGMTPDQISQDAIDRADEALTASLAGVGSAQPAGA